MVFYKIDYCKFDWWMVYQIGQCVGICFLKSECVFFVGDVVYMYSFKVGQGMNVSM